MGGWPTFHNAEVISLSLERATPVLSGVSVARMKVLARQYEPAKVGTVDFHMAFKRGAVVDLRFIDVADNFFEDVIVNSIEVIPSDKQERRLKVEIESIFGVDGYLYCDSVEVENVTVVWSGVNLFFPCATVGVPVTSAAALRFPG